MKKASLLGLKHQTLSYHDKGGKSKVFKGE